MLRRLVKVYTLTITTTQITNTIKAKNQAKLEAKQASVGRSGAESAAIKTAGITTVCPTCKSLS